MKQQETNHERKKLPYFTSKHWHITCPDQPSWYLFSNTHIQHSPPNTTTWHSIELRWISEWWLIHPSWEFPIANRTLWLETHLWLPDDMFISPYWPNGSQSSCYDSGSIHAYMFPFLVGNSQKYIGQATQRYVPNVAAKTRLLHHFTSGLLVSLLFISFYLQIIWGSPWKFNPPYKVLPLI